MHEFLFKVGVHNMMCRLFGDVEWVLTYEEEYTYRRVARHCGRFTRIFDFSKIKGVCNIIEGPEY